MRALLPLLLLSTAAVAQQPGPAERATAAALARVAALNPKLNAVIATDPGAIDAARALDRQRRARGPLFGVPVLVKDNIEIKGALPTTAGSLALKDNVTGRDAPLVARLRAAGAVILGKTNLSEWANIRASNSISGWSAVGGQTRNPYALDRNTCGSSSGSAAAVASGMVDAAIGTETDGSITCPAAVNGIVGLKPTVGLVSRTHIVPISHSQDTAGPMARDVRTAALLLGAIAGSDSADATTRDADVHAADYVAGLTPDALRGQRIGVMRFETGLSSGTDAAFEQALALLRKAGAVLVEIKESKVPDAGDAEYRVLITELKADLNLYLASTPGGVRTRTLHDLIAFNRTHAAEEMALFGQGDFEAAEATKGLSDPAYAKARAASLAAARDNGIDRLLRESRVVALVGPTAGPAIPIDPVNGDRWGRGGSAGSWAAVAGYPHLTVPMGQVHGLPVGLSFIGPAWSEARLLALGFAFEAARGPLPAPTLPSTIDTRAEVARALAPR